MQHSGSCSVLPTRVLPSIGCSDMLRMVVFMHIDLQVKK